MLMDNLVRHATEGVIMSWTKLGQGGHSHVNNRPFEYVKEQMENRGHQPADSQRLRKIATASWLRNNLNAYFKN